MIEKLNGMTKKVFGQLNAAGYTTIENVALASVDELAALPGVTKERARKIINAAQVAWRDEHQSIARVVNAPSPPDVQRSVRIQRIYDANRGG